MQDENLTLAQQIRAKACYSVGCPYCGAYPAERCLNDKGVYYDETQYVHKARRKLAYDKGYTKDMTDKGSSLLEELRENLQD